MTFHGQPKYINFICHSISASFLFTLKKYFHLKSQATNNGSLSDLNKKSSIDEPIYKANVKCAKFNQPTKQFDCGQLNYSLTFSTPLNDNNHKFIIDNKTASVYMTSKSMRTSLASLMKSNYIVLINSILNEPNLNENDRFITSAQTYLAFNIPSSFIDTNRFSFEKSAYKTQILNSLPVNTSILSMKYKCDDFMKFNDEYSFSFFMEEESNLQIETNFYIKHSQMSCELFLLNRISPLSLDKPEINFNLKLVLSKRHNLVISSANTNVNILLLKTRPNVARLNFVAPDSAHYVILPESINMNASIIYQFQTTVKTYDSLIVYSILNKEYTNLFFIDNTFLRVNYPFPDTIDKKRLSYLVCIFLVVIFK